MRLAATVVQLPAITPAELESARDAAVVDLRAPVEFAADHWPGAANVALFDDAQRALVGTLYRQESPDAAFAAGRTAVREHVGPFVRALAGCARRAAPEADLEGAVERLTGAGLSAMQAELSTQLRPLAPRSLVLYCQRGGMRSRATAALLGMLGFERVALVEGGYKRWRKQLADRIAAWRAPRVLVLRGLTGVGKTLVLRELERLRPGATLDLEELAQHRGSVLGMAGLEPRTQRNFETRLALRMPALSTSAIVVEGESRKVGDVILPSSVWRALEGGVNVELVSPLERRVDVLVDDYLAHPASRRQLAAKLPFLEARMRRGGWSGSLQDMLDRGRERELATLLLERYYDPLYRHSERGRRRAASLDASIPRSAAEKLARLLDEHSAP